MQTTPHARKSGNRAQRSLSAHVRGCRKKGHSSRYLLRPSRSAQVFGRVYKQSRPALHAATMKARKSHLLTKRTQACAALSGEQKTSFRENPRRVAITSQCLRNDILLLSLCPEVTKQDVCVGLSNGNRLQNGVHGTMTERCYWLFDEPFSRDRTIAADVASSSDLSISKPCASQLLHNNRHPRGTQALVSAKKQYLPNRSATVWCRMSANILLVADSC